MKNNNKSLNIVVPMAGAGSRFARVGYTLPKPMINVCGRTMIEIVVDNLRTLYKHKFIFICQKTHVEEYGLRELFKQIAPGSELIEINKLTEGAACTVLEASPIINNSDPLMIANSDQYINYPIDLYLEKMFKKQFDGLIMTMKSDDPKWSFVGFDNTNQLVNRVVEKQVISNEATVGIYSFAKGSDFISAAKKMIQRNERINGEFYVAPVYNTLINEYSYEVGTVNIGNDQYGMYGLGTPTDLEFFLSTKIAKALTR